MQISCKKARPYIAEEIKGHIESQIEDNIADGMSYEEAEKNAVADMGDPIAVGISLDKIHKPQIAWKLLVIVGILSLLGILLQQSIFYQSGYSNLEPFMQEMYQLEAESFVTYMDEEILSVVVDEYIYADGETTYDLYCMNFDLKTGTLLNNTDLIEASDDLVEIFIDQSIYQNGYTSSVSDYSNEEIKEFLSDEDSLILFYTPVGLEIGYNHPYGWVTATLKD